MRIQNLSRWIYPFLFQLEADQFSSQADDSRVVPVGAFHCHDVSCLEVLRVFVVGNPEKVLMCVFEPDLYYREIAFRIHAREGV